MTRLSRDDIVAGAGRRFATHGYHGTSMRDLGDDLGILGSSIYAHVGGKQELLVAVIERGAHFFEASATEATDSSEDPMDRLSGLVMGHVGVLSDHRSEARVYLTEVDFLDEPERSRVIGMRDQYESAFRAAIAAGVESGVFRAHHDPKLAAIFVLSILNAVDRWYDESGPLTHEDVGRSIARFVEKALV